MPCGYKVNPELQAELGIVPLIMGAAAAAPAVGKLVGGLFKKKKKKAPPPKPAAPAAAKSSVSKSSAAKKKAAPKTAASTASAPAVQAALAAVPATVKQDVLASLKQFQTQAKSDKAGHEELVGKLAQVVVPDLSKVISAVKDAAVSRQVTSQHNRLMKDDKRWEENQRRQDEIIKKMSQLESALLSNSSRANRIFQIYGVHP
jgi:hypothetical protein